MSEQWEALPAPLDDFVFFAGYCLRALSLSVLAMPTKQQSAVCHWMANGPNRQLTVAFRGLGKSTLAALYALYRLRMDPNEKILVISATDVKARDFTSFCLKCIAEIDLLQVLMPQQGDRFAGNAFDVGPGMIEQSPSMRALGIMGSTTGQRCSCAILDDVETVANVITQFKQERVAHAITEVEAILKPEEGQLLPRRVMYLGTPHAETSLYLRLVRERGYAARYFPALYPEDLAVYDGNLDPTMTKELEADPALVGSPTDPERFSHEDILSRQASTTRSSFLLQFMLNTRLATLDRFPIRLGDLVVMDMAATALPEVVVWSNQPDFRLNELLCVGMGADRFFYRPAFVNGWIERKEAWRCVLAIDPAGRGHDELAWAVLAELNGNLFLLEAGGTRLGYSDEVLMHLAKLARKWEVNYVVPEANMGDGMFTALLKPHLLREWPCTIEEVKHNVRKEHRLCDTLAPVIQQHRLVVLTSVIKRDLQEADNDPETGYQRSLMYQLSRLTAERGCLEFDDRIDAVAIAVAHFVEAAAQDQEQARKDREEELQEAARAAWMDEQGACVDALALGVLPGAGGARPRSYAGIRRRLTVGA